MAEVQEPSPSAPVDPVESLEIDVAAMESAVEVMEADADQAGEAALDESSVEAPIIDGRYEVQSVLGEGGFGVVYRGRQISTSQIVAIKLLHADLIQDATHAKEYIARFEREMQVIGSMKHPNIVRLIDKGVVENGELFMVLEFIDGKSLYDVIENKGPLSLAETMHLMLQVLDALHAAHSLGIVHRDLKPHNIMLTSTGYRRNAMVLDFGIAGVVEGQRGVDYRTLTKASEIRGTPSYMAPEQLRSKKLSPMSDLYAWGLVFIECLTGVPAVDGDSPFEVALWQVGDDPVEIPDGLFGDGLYEILRKVCAKDVKDRYASAAELFEAFEELDLSSVAGARATQIAVAANPNRVRQMENAQTAALDGSKLNLDTDPKGELERKDSRNEVNIVTTMLDGEEIARQSDAYDQQRAQGAGGPSAPRLQAAESRTSPVVVALVAILITLLVGAGVLWAVWPSASTETEETGATDDAVRTKLTATLEQADFKATLDGITEFESLVQEDAGSPSAQGGLARLHATIGARGWDKAETAFAAAREHFEPALQADAKQTDALVAKGLAAAIWDRDFATADSAFGTAMTADPTAGVEYAWFVLGPTGRFDEARTVLDAVDAATPGTLRATLARAHVELLAGNLDEAEAEVAAALVIQSNSTLAHFENGMVEVARGNLNAAQAAFDIARSGGDESMVLAGLGYAYAVGGNATRARELLDLLVAKTKVDGRVLPEHIAWIHIALGELDQAFEWMDKAVEARSPGALALTTHPVYGPLREDPRYAPLQLKTGVR